MPHKFKSFFFVAGVCAQHSDFQLGWLVMCAASLCSIAQLHREAGWRTVHRAVLSLLVRYQNQLKFENKANRRGVQKFHFFSRGQLTSFVFVLICLLFSWWIWFFSNYILILWILKKNIMHLKPCCIYIRRCWVWISVLFSIPNPNLHHERSFIPQPSPLVFV